MSKEKNFLQVIPTFWHSFWHTIWKCIRTFYLTFFLAYILTFFLTFYLASILTYFLAYLYIYTYIFWLSFWHSIWYIFGDSLWLKSGGEHSELAVKLRQGPLWSGACSWGPAGTTAIKSLQLRSGGDRCDQELAVEAPGNHCDQELAVEVRWGPLRSRACGWGDHCNQELAVEVAVEVRRRRWSRRREAGGGRDSWQKI